MPKFLRFKAADAVFILLLLGSGLLLGFSAGGFIVDFKSLGFSVLSQMQMAVHTATTGVVKAAGEVRHLMVLKEENEILNERLRNYESLQRSNAEIRKENERLKEQLGFSQDLAYKNIVARIVGRDPDSLYSSITIDKGSRQGIRKNMPVIAIQDGREGLVGKIVTVGLWTSVIMPIYDEKCNVSARLENARDIGLVNGIGSPDMPLSLKYIKKRVADELNYGDMVVTSGENDNYMRDMPIGSVETVSLVDYEATLIIDIAPVIDFAKLENVVVVDLQGKRQIAPTPIKANGGARNR